MRFPLFVMKWTVFTLFFLICFTSPTSNICCTAQAQSLSDSMIEQYSARLQFRVAKGFAVIDSDSRIIFIDYVGGRLHNFSKKTNRCQGYTIQEPGQQDDFMVHQDNVFAEINVLEEAMIHEEDGRVNHKILYAPRAMRMRGVTVANTKQFGLTFSSKITEFEVAGNHDDFKQLQELSQYNGTIGKINPLVLRLDLTHLLSRLGGVPVRKIEKDGVAELFFSTEKESRLRKLLPAQCEGL